jgi:hypothetical protein
MIRLARRLVLAGTLVAAPAALAQEARPLGDIADNATLRALEARGFGFGRALGVEAGAANAALHASSPAYRRIAATIGGDIRELRAEMAATGRRLYEVTDGNVGRVFEPAWLASPEARFRLVAVVVRLDRRDFAEGERRAATCGELRFLYRLAYDFRRGNRHFASRMPFSVNVVHDLPLSAGGSCADVARKLAPPAGAASPEARAAWVAAGPATLAAARPRQIEVNAQVVRFPSGQETTFGGQAAYVMRVFGVKPGETFELYDRPLENTPDIARLTADAGLRDDLATFLRERSGEVDRGLVSVPERFLATKAISYSTYGSARLANRPYTQVFGRDGAAFAGLGFAALGVARSGAGFIERLDGMTCQGCHQSNATAGFHIIGEDDPTMSPLNRVLIGVSPHFAAERPRRAAYAAAVVSGREPNRFRPLPMAPPAAWDGERFTYRQATLGQACLPAGSARHIGHGWTCAGRATCTELSDNAAIGVSLGQCMVNERSDEFSGQACLAGRIDSAAPARPWLDRFTVGAQLNSHAPRINRRDHTCRPPVGGAPAGLAYRQCDDADRRFAGFRSGQAPPNEICGFAGGRAFDICVATNDFANCLGGSIVRGMRATCSAERLCREDFMCQALPADLPEIGRVAGLGYCSPTYFLFQMRLDGHPDPRRRG